MPFSLPLLMMLLVPFALYAIGTQYFLKRALRRQERHSRALLRETQGMLGAIEHRLSRPRVEYQPSEEGDITWITCFTLDRKTMLERTLRSLKRYAPSVRVLVIDNGSQDGTHELLHRLHSEGVVDKLLFNRKEDVPQWMKCFNLHQAFRLLAAEDVDFLGWIDDDMEVHTPWKEISIAALREFGEKGVKMIALCRDSEQDRIHPPLERHTLQERDVAIKATVNGQFVLFPAGLIRDFGLPPVREGINEYGVEDWYYSRLLQGEGSRCASIDCAIHHGYKISIREALERERKKVHSSGKA